MRRGGLLALVAGLLVAGPTAAWAATPLGRLVLAPAQVGPGYVRHTIPGGSNVAGQVTLDVCKTHYATEALRVARLQVAYAKSGSPTQLSNEVVRYRPGGAASAMAEIVNATNHCPTTPIPAPEQGVGLVRYAVRRLKPTGLPSGSIVLDLHATSGGQTVEAIIAYQRRGAVLSAVYVIGGARAAMVSLALHAAAQSARNLRSP